jgi:hypothetical protein
MAALQMSLCNPLILEHPQSSCTVSLKAERSGKTWIMVEASRGEACIQASFTGWNLVLEGFIRGLVTGFGMFCFGKTLRLGRMTFSWLRGYRITRRLGMLLPQPWLIRLNAPNMVAPRKLGSGWALTWSTTTLVQISKCNTTETNDLYSLKMLPSTDSPLQNPAIIQKTKELESTIITPFTHLDTDP